MKLEYTEPVGSLWTPLVAAAFEGLRNCVLKDPVLKRFGHRKLTVLRTDFSAKGFGYVICQPGDDEASVDLVTRYMMGQGFEFLTKSGLGTLHPVAFGSRRCRGNEKRLHSYLGEIFAGDWSMNKCRHMCVGRRFIWVTDCYAARFLMTYDGSNPAVLRLQMRMMGWDVDIVHRANDFLVDADYWSRLDADLCYDPSFKDYLHIVSALWSAHPAPSTLPMRPEHMPYYRGPRIRNGDAAPPDDDNAGPSPDPADQPDSDSCTPSATVHRSTVTSLPLSIVPVCFGTSADTCPNGSSAAKYNAEFPALAFRVTHFAWALYSFNSGHFLSSIVERNLPFIVTLACDPRLRIPAGFLQDSFIFLLERFQLKERRSFCEGTLKKAGQTVKERLRLKTRSFFEGTRFC